VRVPEEKKGLVGTGLISRSTGGAPSQSPFMSPVKITELRLRHYRAFADTRLLLDDITFLVGRNGAGKSTLMDAMSFVSEAVTDSLRHGEKIN
jgi:hypothetical protein